MLRYLFVCFIFISSPLFSIDNLIVRELRQVTVASKEGSADEIKTFNIIKQLALKNSLKYKQIPFDSFNNSYHSFSSNLEIVIDGTNNQEFIYVCSINAPFLTIYSMLSLIEKLADEDLETGARFVFLGAEQGSEWYYPIGSNNYFKQYSPSGESTIIYFNLKNSSNLIQISPLYSPRVDLDNIKKLQKVLFSQKITTIYNENFKLFKNTKEGNINMPHIPSLVINSHPLNLDFKTKETVWMQNFTLALYQNHIRTKHMNSNLDYNYFNLSLVFISEFQLVVLYLVILFMLLIPMTNPYSRINNYLRSSLSSFNTILIFSLILLASNFLSTFITNHLIKEELRQHITSSVFLFKTLFTLFLATGFIPIFKTINITFNDSICISSSFFISIINTIILLFFKIDLALWQLFFLVSTICIFYIHKPLLKSIFAFILIFSNILFLAHILLLISQNITIINKNDLIHNFILTILQLPLFLFCKPIYYPQNHRPIKRQIITIIVLLLIYFYIIKYKPYAKLKENKETVFISYIENNSINETSFLLKTRYVIDKLKIDLNNGIDLILNNIVSDIGFNAYSKPFFTYTTNKKYPLGRQKLNLSINFNNNVENLYIELTANKNIGTIDCNYPITIEDPLNHPNKATIYVGKNPPKNLNMYIVTKEMLSFKLKVVAVNHNNITVTGSNEYDFQTIERLEDIIQID